MKTSTTDMVEQLRALVEQATEGRVIVPHDGDPNWVRATGIDSLDLLNFLVTVEDEFGIEWRDEVPKETLYSFEAMAEHIRKELAPVA